MSKKTSETATTIPIMRAVTADPASMAKTELDRLREENRELKAKLFMATQLVKELRNGL